MDLVLTSDASPAFFQFVRLIVDNHAHPSNANIQRCPRCAAPLQTIVVHGHEACANCKSNIMECCTGTLVLPITIWPWGIKDHRCLGEGSLWANKLPVGKLSPNWWLQKMSFQSHPRLRTTLQQHLPKKNQKKPPALKERARRKQMHPNLHHKHLWAIFQAFPRPSIVLDGIKFLENQN